MGSITQVDLTVIAAAIFQNPELTNHERLLAAQVCMLGYVEKALEDLATTIEGTAAERLETLKAILKECQAKPPGDAPPERSPQDLVA